MKYLNASAAKQFAEAWLPAWTGNDPARLASFYSDDAFYLDPGVPAGVKGKSKTLEVVGVCLVQLDDKIRRNEVYFDRTQLLAEIASYRASRKQT